jgi:hypothetical protein
MDQHRMTYQAGLVIDCIPTEPFWFCPCGRYRYRAQAMPRRKTGNNKIEAERAFAAHLDAAPAISLGD